MSQTPDITEANATQCWCKKNGKNFARADQVIDAPAYVDGNVLCTASCLAAYNRSISDGAHAPWSAIGAS